MPHKYQSSTGLWVPVPAMAAEQDGLSSDRLAVTRRTSSLAHESLVLWRLSSDAPETLLANQHERLAIDGSFSEAVG